MELRCTSDASREGLVECLGKSAILVVREECARKRCRRIVVVACCRCCVPACTSRQGSEHLFLCGPPIVGSHLSDLYFLNIGFENKNRHLLIIILFLKPNSGHSPAYF